MGRPLKSRAIQLLAEWQGEALQKDAAKMLGVDQTTYSRFLHGKRKPTAHVAVTIEKITNGRVPTVSWYEPPIAES